MQINTPYFLYMAEAEGFDSIVTTKQARINAAIKDFVKYHKQGYDINVYKYDILKAHGLYESTLTDSECNYIMRTVEKRING